MKNIINLVKNEYIKLVYEKKIYIIFVYMILLTFFTAQSYNSISKHISEIHEYPPNMQLLLSNLNVINYLKIFSTDSLFGGTTQFSVMIVALLAIDVFLYDYKSGNAKFVLASGISKFELTISKYIYMLINIIIFILMFFFLGFIIGIFLFGTKEITIFNFLETFFLYLSAVIPMAAFVSIIALVSITNINKSLLTLLTIMSIIMIGISDSFSNTKFFSPTGMLALYNSDVPLRITTASLHCALTELAYFMITFFIYMFIIEKKDIF